MKDFRPGDERIVAAVEHRSMSGRLLLGAALVLAISGSLIYQFKPDWAARVKVLAHISRPLALAQDGKSPFLALYQRYQLTPLSADLEENDKVNSLLAGLQKEPCDKQTVFQADVALENLNAVRAAADILQGFANSCPESSGERYRASELYYLLGDYDTAVKLSSDLINHQPDAQKAYFVRARSEQGLKRYAAAVDDYATLIRLLPDTKAIVPEVFTRMSEAYEKLDRPCEAIGPLQTYIALDSANRSTPPLLKRIAALAAKGNCAQVYAKGTARIMRRSNGVSTAKAQINGVEGTFVVDTGASFVTLTRSFAERARPQMFKTDAVEMQTANGTTSATLATVDSVRLASLSASSVPAIVANKNLGDGIDGLLGMSFLSRFTMVIQDREILLKAKQLEE